MESISQDELLDVVVSWYRSEHTRTSGIERVYIIGCRIQAGRRNKHALEVGDNNVELDSSMAAGVTSRNEWRRRPYVLDLI